MKRIVTVLALGACLAVSAERSIADDDVVACVNKTCPAGYRVVGLAGGGNLEESADSSSSVACVCAREAEMEETVETNPPNDGEG